MEIWNYINILRKSEKSSFLNNTTNIDEKLTAIEFIKSNGNSSLISELIPILKSNNLKLRDKTFEVIKYFYKKISSGKVLYQSLKYCQISKQDLDFFKQSFSTEDYLVLVSIATYNYDGYVREKAIDELGNSNDIGKILNPLLHRLSDWVKINRVKAAKIIGDLKQVDNLKYFAGQIDAIEQLKKVNRTNLTEIYNELVTFIVAENKTQVLSKFGSYPDKKRVLLTKLVIESPNLELSDLKIFINDKNFLVRSLALKRFDLLGNDEIKSLLADKSSKIRLQTLYALEKNENISNIVYDFLADTSSSIRNFARFILKNENIDFKELYSKNLQQNHSVEGSLYGLKEIDGKEFINEIITFLNCKVIKIVKAAFNTIKEFEPKTAYNFALNNISSNSIGIRKISIEYLYKNPTSEVIEKARTLFHSENLQLRKSMLKLFSKIGKYKCLDEILNGTIDENKDIRILSNAYLKDWVAKSSKYFISPTQDEIKLIKESVEKVKLQLKDDDYVTIKTLKEIEFHIR